jgi:translation initiation factor IF-2
LDGAPQAGDTFNVMDDEREAKQIAQRRQQLSREQSVRSQKSLTLEEIGRRLAVGDYQELNIILKGDVDGSIEALSDSLQRLSTPEIQVNIIHKAVGQVTESDVLLASASKAIIVGFQVRPSATARKLAEKEEIEIRLYSIIYDAINDIRDAMSGMLSPEVKEEIACTVEVREAPLPAVWLWTAPSTETPACASSATAWSSTPVNWVRSSASRTTFAKSPKALIAV